MLSCLVLIRTRHVAPDRAACNAELPHPFVGRGRAVQYDDLLVAGDVVEGGVELGLEAAAVVFAEDDEVGRVADTLGHLPAKLCLKCGGVDVVAVTAGAVAKGASVVEVDVGVGLQGAVGAIGALADGVDGGEDGLGTHGFYLAHADGVDVAKDYVRNALGCNVAVVCLVGLDIVRGPYGILQSAWAFFVAGPHHLGRLVEESAEEVVEVVLITA